jgi:DNA-binding GntR family transcriptional regulator
MFGQLESISKKDRIVVLMRDAILKGKINPGDPIIESRVAQELGVGQPLVREALIELEHQGFVQRVPYKGTRVTKLTWDDIEHIFRLRSELEGIAGEWARARATEDEIAELRGLVEKMQAGAEAVDLPRFYEFDLAFHRRIWELSGNRYLVDMLERLVVPLFAFFVLKVTREQESYVASAERHMELVNALATKSPAEVREFFREALGAFKQQLADRLLTAENG